MKLFKKYKENSYFYLTLLSILCVSLLFAYITWDELRGFEKELFIISISGISLMLLVSIFFDVYVVIRNMFIVSKKITKEEILDKSVLSDIQKANKFLEKYSKIEKQYNDTVKLRKQIEKVEKKLSNELKKLDSEIGDTFNNNLYK